MKKFISLTLVIIFFTSCAIKKKPKFIKIDDIEVVNVTPETVTVEAQVIFENLNDIGGEMETKGIKVLINDVEMAEVSSEKFKVPARKEFMVPMLVNIATKDVVKSKDGDFYKDLIKTLFKQETKVQYLGKIKYKVFGTVHYYPIDKTKILKIKF